LDENWLKMNILNLQCKNKNKNLDNKGKLEDSTSDVKIYNIIFDPVKSIFNNKGCIILYRTQKANGENC